MFSHFQSIEADCEKTHEPEAAPFQTPDDKYKLHQQTRQKESTQKFAKREIKAYKAFAIQQLL